MGVCEGSNWRCYKYNTADCHTIKYVPIKDEAQGIDELGYFEGGIRCEYLNKALRKPRGENKTDHVGRKVEFVSLNSTGGRIDVEKEQYYGYLSNPAHKTERDFMEEDKELDKLVNKFRQRFPEQQGKVFNGLFEGQNITALARSLGVSHQAVSKLARKVREGVAEWAK